MRRVLITLGVVFVLVFSLVPLSRAPGTPYTVRIYVQMDGSPVSGALVNVSLPRYGVGDTALEIDPGVYDVNLGNPPYSDVLWQSGDTVRVDVSYGNYYEWATQRIDTSRGYNWFTVDLEEEQYPPHEPDTPSPAHQATGMPRDVALSVEVVDPNGDDLTVRFYNASSHALIGTDTHVPSGSTASVSWSGLAFNVTYSWYAVADDGLFTNQSDTWEFTTREPRLYTLTVSVHPSDGGTVTLDPDRDSYYEEETVVMEAHPATGYVFDRWSGDIVGTNARKVITMYGNKTVTARFTPVQYTLNVSADPPEGGTVTCDPPTGPYDAGTTVTLTAVPADGYLFDSWQGDATGTTTPLNVTMDANRSIIAHFSVNVPPSIAIVSPSNNSTVSGTITVEGTASDDNGNHTLQQVDIQIDDGSWQVATGTSTWHFIWNTTGVSDGPHVIRARASDGHTSTETSTQVEVCHQAPVTRHQVHWASHPWIPRNPDPDTVSVITLADAVNLTVSSPRQDAVSTYYRWSWWNESSGTYEFWPTPDTPGAVNGSEITVSEYEEYITWTDDPSFWHYQTPPHGGYIWWMPYTGDFSFTEGCNHTLYYFSTDDLCNTEQPNYWEVGVDDEAPGTTVECDNSTSGSWIHYGEDHTIYFQNCTWFIINATDVPAPPDCQTGIWKIDYTIHGWAGNQTDGAWQTLVPWTSQCSNGSGAPPPAGIAYAVGPNASWMRLAIHPGEVLSNLTTGTSSRFQVQWRAYDYGNQTSGLSGQYLSLDDLPPISRVDNITPYIQQTTPFNITVIEIEDFGYEAAGPSGVCKVEVYYNHSRDNETWDGWVLYDTWYVPWEQRLDVPDWTLSFDAPEGAGWYRFKSIAYDCVGVREEDGGPESSVHLDVPIYLSVGQPAYGSWIAPSTPLNITGSQNITSLFYRLFNNGTWSPLPGSGYGRDNDFHLYAGHFTLAQHGCTDGNVTIEYYGQETLLYSRTFRLDGEPPQVSFSSPLSSLHCRSVTAAASAVDNGSGVREVGFSYRYSADNQSWGNWSHGATLAEAPYQHTFSLPTGYYQLGAQARDHLGHSGSATSAVVRIFNPDINDDDRVNILDLIRIARHWQEAAEGDTHIVDLNGDQVIGMSDLVLAGRYWTG